MSSFPIAVVGASCRLPNAPDLSALADLLFAGRDAVTEIPPDRWSRGFYFDPDPKQPGKSYTFAGCVLDHIDRFDAGFFGMSPREAANTDERCVLRPSPSWESAAGPSSDVSPRPTISSISSRKSRRPSDIPISSIVTPAAARTVLLVDSASSVRPACASEAGANAKQRVASAATSLSG